MVRAIVTREADSSYTVTFGDAATLLNNQKIVHVPVASSGTSQLERAKAVWKTVVHEVDLGIQAVSIYAATEPQKALDEAGKLSTKLTTAYKVIENVVKNEDKNAVIAEKQKITSTLGKIFAKANKAKKKGGRRTRRKHTRRKYIS
jgi:NADH dehydrogenase/NADH:ubiquinone oxidoreductase subunit G